MSKFAYLNGKKFCVVFAKHQGDDPNSGKVELSTMNGIAVVNSEGVIAVDIGTGNPFCIPQSSYQNIHPSDGTDLLKDAEYFVIVKVHGMDLM